MSSLAARRRRHIDDEPGQMCIPGLGENKPRPRELGCSFFGYIPDAYSNNLPLLPSESSHSPRSGNSSIRNITSEESSRSASPRGGDETAHASDSSQMRETLWQPLSPESDNRKEVEEELCVAVDARKSAATPFFDHAAGKLLIRGGKVVNDDGVVEADVLVDTTDGTIIAVGNDLEASGDCKVIDASDKYVMPGGIDFSTTLHDTPDDDSLPLADDFSAGTRAALAGGTTMIVDNVIPKKGQSLLEAFAAWKEDAEENAHCDVVAKVTVPRWDESVKAEMEELAKQEGVTNFKVYMAFKDTLMLSNTELMDVFDHCKSLGCVVHVHAENGDIIAENEKRLLARGITGPEGHLMARPEELEEEAVKRVCALAKKANVPLVICGPTSKEALAVIAEERSRGQVVLGLPTAAALALDGSHYYNDCWNHAAAFVTSPPLRDDPNTPDILSSAVANDEYQMVCSDNKTYSADVKAMGKGDFTCIPHGINGVEDRLGVVWERIVHSEKTDTTRFVAVTSTNVAKALGVYPRKGRIEAGSDADILVWNPNNLRSISRKTHLQSVNFNVFEGMKIHGAPEFVLAGGRVVVYEYEVNPTGGSGKGRVIATPSFPPTLYDAVQDLDAQNKLSAVNRELDETAASSNGKKEESKVDGNFGVTTPRNWGIADDPVLNKRLGVYQRPLSAHGIRNQQDSTFSLAGGYGPEELQGSPKRTVKVNAPPGGGMSKGAFW